MREPDLVTENVALADRLASWLRSAGVTRTELAVDLADTLGAARHVQVLVDQLLALEPANPQDAERALQHLGALHAWLFGEMKYHIEELWLGWPEIEAKLEEALPEQPSEQSQSD